MELCNGLQFLIMKYIITESRLENIILEFLNSNFVPYDGWDPEGYRKELQNSTEIFLFLDNLDTDESMWYNRGGKSKKRYPVIVIPHEKYKTLTNLFGEYWKPIFIKWFEENTKLPVKSVDEI
jgi:hypothetical protein